MFAISCETNNCLKFACVCPYFDCNSYICRYKEARNIIAAIAIVLLLVADIAQEDYYSCEYFNAFEIFTTCPQVYAVR